MRHGAASGTRPGATPRREPVPAPSEDPEEEAATCPEDWPARPDPILAMNRMGSFDWDLDSGRMHMDRQALAVFGLRPERFDDMATTASAQMPRAERDRMAAVVKDAITAGHETYAGYFRIRRADDSLRWTHTQGYIRRDAGGRARRIFGIVRDATQELSDTTARREQASELRRRTTVVERTTAALAAARTVADVLDVLREQDGLVRLGADSLVVGLLEQGRIRLVPDGPTGGVIDAGRHTRLDDPYPMADVVRTMRPVYLEDAESFAAAYPELWKQIAHLRPGAAAYLPLVAQGSPIGSLGLFYGGTHHFAPEERNVLVALGSSLAQSLQRAMLYEQEKDLAQGLQQAMLPRTIPDVPGAEVAVRYRAASAGRDVGGDWYDLVPLPGGRTGAVIGDVQGHDTHAAAVMGQLRIALRAYAAEGHPPATVMARTSLFLDELDTDRFATCLYAEADLSTGVLQLVRAGHLDPFLMAPDGSARRVPVPGGLPLGLSSQFGALDYPVSTLELDPGATLLLCTDGLVEVPGADLDDGFAKLATQLRTGPRDLRLLADLLTTAVERRGGEDDVAVLLLRRRATVGAPLYGGRLQQHVAPGDPRDLAEARRMIRSAVRSWGAGSRSDDIELATDELVVNALTHTEGPALVTLRVLTGAVRRLRVEVEDSSSALPRRREADAEGQSGRGLMLVDLLADAWGVEARGAGKCVWCEFEVRRPGEEVAGPGPAG
ncbi:MULTISPECIES: SpoIIE family protein phosphatase [unclassified Streptomyces]|uniref:SpoIIE family protein phosphatase n=1 Tax=unclassified Streptomyces TaxID=2593676 RepID=UPI000B89A6D3|nr:MULTISPECIES: SpoIIE family protein phosphatase [unclassified Streptomyces]MYR29563.1 SpoIIE family protein phosphatase [Streptomyces sp. SID4945]